MYSIIFLVITATGLVPMTFKAPETGAVQLDACAKRARELADTVFIVEPDAIEVRWACVRRA